MKMTEDGRRMKMTEDDDTLFTIKKVTNMSYQYVLPICLTQLTIKSTSNSQSNDYQYISHPAHNQEYKLYHIHPWGVLHPCAVAWPPVCERHRPANTDVRGAARAVVAHSQRLPVHQRERHTLRRLGKSNYTIRELHRVFTQNRIRTISDNFTLPNQQVKERILNHEHFR